MRVTDRELRTSLRGLAWAGWAATLSGVIWLVVWVHYLAAHGTTSFDYQRTPLGLSWYDSTRSLVIALALIVLALALVRVGHGWVATLSRYAAIVGWTGAAIGIVWTLGLTVWGSTTLSISFPGAALTALGPALGAVATIVYGRRALLVGLLPRGSGIPLSLGLFTAFPWLQGTLISFAFGLTWIAIGILLIRAPRKQPSTIPD
ncbi:MAG: hypothetical protein ACE5MI_14275 [Acidimicrobiia bacterium]